MIKSEPMQKVHQFEIVDLNIFPVQSRGTRRGFITYTLFNGEAKEREIAGQFGFSVS